MKCEVKYRPIIWRTPDDVRAMLKSAYIQGEQYCPACVAGGRMSRIEERFGETL
ncbi:MAG: hypothetical protein HY751_05540 [Nitrospinae bacterium]|nr:hypothetical protein [Nitrospinota bacterium]